MYTELCLENSNNILPSAKISWFNCRKEGNLFVYFNTIKNIFICFHRKQGCPVILFGGLYPEYGVFFIFSILINTILCTTIYFVCPNMFFLIFRFTPCPCKFVIIYLSPLTPFIGLKSLKFTVEALSVRSFQVLVNH